MKRWIFIATIITMFFGSIFCYANDFSNKGKEQTTDAVCPPFFLKDEAGNVIDPINNLNADKPYSPKQTCGATGCHDYDKITKGYHFTQGAGEKPTAGQTERIQWGCLRQAIMAATGVRQRRCIAIYRQRKTATPKQWI